MGITIFTPTYNRAYILEKLYKSLCEQSNKDFEWLIIDDGSTDNTKQMIESFKKENHIKIKYVYQENGGKSIAHNKGVELATEELFTCVDSDDYLEPDAIELILSTWEHIKNKAVGIIAKRKYSSGENITQIRDNNMDFLVLKDAYKKKMISGDTFLIFETTIIKQFQFPQICNEKFIPEDYIYDKIGEIGKLYLLNKALYVCDYLPDGYTCNMAKLIANNPQGYRLYLTQRIDKEKSWYNKFIYYLKYESISFVIESGYIYNSNVFWTILTFVPGWIIYKIRFCRHVNRRI